MVRQNSCLVFSLIARFDCLWFTRFILKYFLRPRGIMNKKYFWNFVFILFCFSSEASDDERRPEIPIDEMLDGLNFNPNVQLSAENALALANQVCFDNLTFSCFVILDAWEKPTLGPTQGQYSVVVVMFGTCSQPPSNISSCRSYIFTQ